LIIISQAQQLYSKTDIQGRKKFSLNWATVVSRTCGLRVKKNPLRMVLLPVKKLLH